MFIIFTPPSPPPIRTTITGYNELQQTITNIVKIRAYNGVVRLQL